MSSANNTFTKILSTITVGSGGSANIEFTSIPNTYTDLCILTSTRCNIADIGENIAMQFNNDTGSNYNWIRMYADGTQTYSDKDNPVTRILSGFSNGATSTANTFSSQRIYISNYASSNYKAVSMESVGEANTTGTLMMMMAGLWNSSSAISSIKLYFPGSTQFSQYSTATLYGILKTSAAAKATGGTISYDGTYFYHTFTSSGTFTPTSNITADYLVVAGGGGGGPEIGGGGGAGGLRSTVGTTGGGASLESAISLVSSTSYTVTVGAGGAGRYSPNNQRGNNGSDSSIAGSGLTTITSTGGGGGGANSTNDSGNSGGSGGGAASSASGGTGTSGQGYAGGSVSSGAGSAGGGGAGTAGYTGSGDVGTAGGNGVAITAFSLATNTGVNGYYAGGGGGAGYLTSGGAGGAGGGGAGGSYNTSSGGNGTANTGGGAGGNASVAPAGTGGSGIVIIRYTA